MGIQDVQGVAGNSLAVMGDLLSVVDPVAAAGATWHAGWGTAAAGARAVVGDRDVEASLKERSETGTRHEMTTDPSSP